MERLGIDLEEWHHFSLFLAVDQVMVVLHGDEWGQVVLDGVVWVRSKKINSLGGVWVIMCTYSAWRGLEGKKRGEWMSRRSTMLDSLHCQAQQLLIPI